MARVPWLKKRGGTSAPNGPTTAVPLDDVLAMLNARAKQRDYRGGNRTPDYMPVPGEWNTDPFGPGYRIKPEAINNLRNDTRRPDPRIYEYPIAWNLRTTQQRLIPWSTLRGASLAPLIRPIITKRQKDLTSLKWDVAVTRGAIEKAAKSANSAGSAADKLALKFAPEIDRVSEFWQMPDLEQGYAFEDWLWALAEEQLALDALAISPRVTYGGDVFGFRIVDGSTIKPLLDPYGARPMPPAPAFQQILYGFPRGEFTADLNDNGDVEGYPADQLVYRRRSIRAFSPYGLSPVEESLLDLDLFLKRHGWMRAEYTEGTLAEAYLKSPQDLIWSPQQLLEYERELNDATSGSTQDRHRMRMLPPGVEPIITGDTAERYKPEYDHYLIELLCSHFGEHADELGFNIGRGALGGSGKAQAAKQTSAESGLFPDARFYARFITWLSREYLGLPKECEFKFLDIDSEDPALADKLGADQVADGRKTLNEERDRLGFPRYDDPLADKPLIITPTVAMTLDQVQAVSDQAVETAKNPPLQPAVAQAPGAVANGAVNGPAASQAQGQTPQGQGAAQAQGKAKPQSKQTQQSSSKKSVASDRTAAIGLAQAELNVYRRWVAKRGPDPTRQFEFGADETLLTSLADVGELSHCTFKATAAHDVASAAKVHKLMAESFPDKAIDWVHSAAWQGPVKVDTSKLDMDDQNSWAASHDHDRVGKYQDDMEAGKKMKPAVLIREPGKTRMIVVDGHHHVLAAVHAGMKLRAYVGTVQAGDVAAAMQTHSSQLPKTTIAKAGPKGYEHGGVRVGQIGARTDDPAKLADAVQRDGHANTSSVSAAASAVDELHRRGIPAQHELILVRGDYRRRVYDLRRANHGAGLKSADVTKAQVQYEWQASNQACPECLEQESHDAKPKGSWPEIPLHPNCECELVPTGGPGID